MHHNDGFYLMVEVRPGFLEEIIICQVTKWISRSNLLKGGRKDILSGRNNMLVGIVFRRERYYWKVILAGVGRGRGRLPK